MGSPLFFAIREGALSKKGQIRDLIREIEEPGTRPVLVSHFKTISVWHLRDFARNYVLSMKFVSWQPSFRSAGSLCFGQDRHSNTPAQVQLDRMSATFPIAVKRGAGSGLRQFGTKAKVKNDLILEMGTPPAAQWCSTSKRRHPPPKYTSPHPARRQVCLCPG